MWLYAAYLIGLLSVIQGLHLTYARDNDVSSDPCIAKILSCDWFRQPFSLYKEKIKMFTEVEDLNKACRKQAAYMRCIVRAEKFCEQNTFSPMAEEMIKSRHFPTEICRPASPWQQLYLKEASCLNSYSRKAFVHCANNIGIDNLNPDFMFHQVCKHGKAIVDCSATVLQEKCGYYAGSILKKLLMFHSLTDYECSELQSQEKNAYAFSSTPDYDATKAIVNVLDPTVFEEDFSNESTEEASDVNKNFEETMPNNPESEIASHDSILEEHILFDFNRPLTDESFMTTEYFLTESLDSDVELQTMESEFPALPNYYYIHKNKTTFALYKDLEMGHTMYMGCGEADFFWVILSPLRTKYCILTDVKSEYSEALFKCTLRVDAPCSSEMDEDDRNKKAEVFHRRYVITVLTPPNNQRSEDMAVMNVHYLKLYPSPSMHVPEKKVNLWTTESNEPNIEKTEYVGRKGPLDLGNVQSFLYHGARDSDRKSDKDALFSPTYLNEDEYLKNYRNWLYYHLEEGDAKFPELRTNNIIYIEDDNGDFISLHDSRSPIHMKSEYQPHSLFRPRLGTMRSTNAKHDEKMGDVSFSGMYQNSVKKRISEFKDDASASKVKSDQKIYFRKIKSLNNLVDTNQLRQEITSFIKLNKVFYLKPFIFKEVFVVTASAEIEAPKSTKPSEAERHKDDLISNHSREDVEFTADDCPKYLFKTEL